jgi:hypothetical protein
MLPFFAMDSYRFHRKKQLNYAEHLVLNAYLYSLITLVGIPMIVVYIFLDSIMLSPIMGLVFFSVFGGIIFKKLFFGSLAYNVFKAFIAFVLGYVLFLLLAGVIGFVAAIIVVFLSRGGG